MNSGPVIIEDLPPDKCQLCGKHDELRPYGVGGIWVCFACAMKDKKSEAIAQQAFMRRFTPGGKKAL